MKNTLFLHNLTIYQLHAPQQNKALRLGENKKKVSCGNDNGNFIYIADYMTSKLCELLLKDCILKHRHSDQP